MANLTATNLMISASNLLTGIGNLISSLTANRLSFNHTNQPSTIEQVRDIIQTVHDITDSTRQLIQQIRERDRNQVTLTELEQHDGVDELELDDIDEPERVEQPEQTEPQEQPHTSTETPIEPAEIETSPATTMTATTTSTVQTVEPNNDSLAVITDRDGNDYTLSRLADMTYEQLSQLVNSVDGLSISSHVQNALFHTYTLFMRDHPIVQRRFNRQIATFTPSLLQFRTRLHRQTTSHWSIESNGSTFRAIDIERLTVPQRMHLDVYLDNTIYYMSSGNQLTGESWTEIRDVETNNLLAIIDYQVPSRATFTGNHITFTTPYSRQNIDADGMHMSITNDDGSRRRIDIGRDGLVVDHEAVIPTESTWIVPGTSPAISATDIEHMDEHERNDLANRVQSHGNILRYRHNTIELTGESWTDVIYDGEVVARIDQRVHNVASIDGESFIIGNPEAAHLEFGQGVLRWVRYITTGEVSREDATIRGIFDSVVSTTIHNISDDFWSWTFHHTRDLLATSALLFFNPMNIPRYIGTFIAIPYILTRTRPNPRPRTLAESDEPTESTTEPFEYSLQPLLDWCLYEGDDTDLDITMERANEYVVSFETCMTIAKIFRDSLKGPLALLCSKIMDIEENGLTVPPSTVSTSDIEKIESRIIELERKTANIDNNERPNTSGELNLANLLKSYDERIRILEKKCANIQ